MSEIDRARSQHYALLASLLLRAPTADLLRRLAGLKGDATRLGQAQAVLAEAASEARGDAARVASEYFELFVGVGRGELLPYGSYYLTGFLHERPLARLRADMSMLGIERAEGFSEPEDHLGIICEIMAGLVLRRFDAEEGTEQRFFLRHVEPFALRFFTDLTVAQGARFYRAVGALGQSFIGIEAEAFGMEA